MSQDNWIEQLEQDAAKAGGGGGIIGQCEINRGYKFMVTGVDNRKSFFPYASGDEAAKKAAEGKAKKALVELGSPMGKNNKPIREQDSVEIIVYKNSVKGREVTWQDDRFFITPLWTDAFKQIVFPSIKETKAPVAKKFWAKVSFAPDPSGRTKADQNGEQKAELIAFIAQVYATEAEAQADAGSGGASSTGERNPLTPPDYDDTTWQSVKQDAVDAVNTAITSATNANKAKPKVVKEKAIADARIIAVEKFAGEYGATPQQVEALLNS